MEERLTEPVRVRVYDARYNSAFTALILEALQGEERITVQREPMDFSLGGRKALIAFTAPPDEDISQYDWIHVAGAGIDKLVRGLKDEGHLPVMTRTIGAMGQQIAEYVLSYILSDFQRHPERLASEDVKEWKPGLEAERYLFESTVAIIGTGGIGSEIAEALKPLTKATVGVSRSGCDKPPFDQVYPLSEKTALGKADVVILALPNTAHTDGLISDDLLGEMRDALLINVGRGEPLDERALLRALDGGNVRHAVLDVFREEPLPQDHWAWTDERVTVTSHLSGITRPADTVKAFLHHLHEAGDGLPKGTVDPQQGY